MDMANANAQAERHQNQSSRVTERVIESAPTAVIQVERVRVSDAHRSSIAEAIREGRRSAGKE
jgi:actin-like ATPase involved in cell morphogenesis